MLSVVGKRLFLKKNSTIGEILHVGFLVSMET